MQRITPERVKAAVKKNKIPLIRNYSFQYRNGKMIGACAVQQLRMAKMPFGTDAYRFNFVNGYDGNYGYISSIGYKDGVAVRLALKPRNVKREYLKD